VKKEGGKPPPGGFFVARGRFFDSSKLERKRPIFMGIADRNRAGFIKQRKEVKQ